MECDAYQHAALRTARDKDARGEFMHLVLGLVGEAGEIAEKVKKLVRDKNSDLAQLDIDDMAAELGDVLWYAAVLANFLGLSLNDVAQRNVDKLTDRQRRAVIGGSGDTR
ncbi:MAG: nucleoside triphosphate pyrophosphohydrolase family protein [Nocardioidaceae bacterium]